MINVGPTPACKPKANPRENRFNSRGVGLVEVLVATAVMAASALVLSRAISELSAFSSLAAGGAECQAAAQNVLESIRAEQISADISNYYPVFNSSFQRDNPPTFQGGLTRNPASAPWIPPTTGTVVQPTQIHPWVMTNNSVNWLWSLYNQYDLCSSPVLVRSVRPLQVSPTLTAAGEALVATGLVPPAPMSQSDLDILLRLQAVDLRTNVSSCPQSLYIPPTGANSASTPRGIKVTVMGRVRAATSASGDSSPWKSCQASTVLAHPSDFIPPTLSSASGTVLDPVPAGADPGSPPTGGCNAANIPGSFSGYCSSPANPIQVYSRLPISEGGGFTTDQGMAPWRNTASTLQGFSIISRANTYSLICFNSGPTLFWTFRTNERAAAFQCQMFTAAPGNQIDLASAPMGDWYNCMQFQPSGPLAMVAQSVARANATDQFNGIRLTTGWSAPHGNYLLRVRAVDGAQNVSQVAELNFRVDTRCPATWTNNFCPHTTPVGARLAPYSDQCGTPGMCDGTMPLTCTDATQVACGDPIKDACGRDCPTTGRLLNHRQCAINRSAVACQGAVYDNCGNLCPPEYQGSAPNAALALDTSCDQQRVDPCGHSHGPGSQPPSYCPGTACSATCGQQRPVPPGCPAGSCGIGVGAQPGWITNPGLEAGNVICDGCNNQIGEGTCTVQPCGLGDTTCGTPPDCPTPPTPAAVCECTGSLACPTRSGYVFETWCTGSQETATIQQVVTQICASNSACNSLAGEERATCLSAWQAGCDNSGASFAATVGLLTQASLPGAFTGLTSTQSQQIRDTVDFISRMTGGQNILTRLNLSSHNSATFVTPRAGGAVACIDSSATVAGQLKQGGTVVGTCTCPCNPGSTNLSFVTNSQSSTPMADPGGMNSGASLPSCPFGGEPSYTACQ